VANGAHLQFVFLAPVGNALVYVLDNDIYYRASGYAGSVEQRVTFNGVPGVFYNGVPDWVYEGDFFIRLQQSLPTLSKFIKSFMDHRDIQVPLIENSHSLRTLDFWPGGTAGSLLTAVSSMYTSWQKLFDMYVRELLKFTWI
jgi:hypothetical protein